MWLNSQPGVRFLLREPVDPILPIKPCLAALYIEKLSKRKHWNVYWVQGHKEATEWDWLERLHVTAKAKIAKVLDSMLAFCPTPWNLRGGRWSRVNVVQKNLANLVVMYILKKCGSFIFLTGSDPKIYPSCTEPTQNNCNLHIAEQNKKIKIKIQIKPFRYS